MKASSFLSENDVFAAKRALGDGDFNRCVSFTMTGAAMLLVAFSGWLTSATNCKVRYDRYDGLSPFNVWGENRSYLRDIFSSCCPGTEVVGIMRKEIAFVFFFLFIYRMERNMLNIYLCFIISYVCAVKHVERVCKGLAGVEAFFGQYMGGCVFGGCQLGGCFCQPSDNFVLKILLFKHTVNATECVLFPMVNRERQLNGRT